jgi:hypothetical protein
MNSEIDCASTIRGAPRRRNRLVIGIMASAAALAAAGALADVNPMVQSARWDTLILASDGSVWGCGAYGNYVEGNGFPNLERATGSTRRISGGKYLAFADKTIKGENFYGEFGVDPTLPGYDYLSDFTDIGTVSGTPVAGYIVSYVITAGGGVLAAGANNIGQLGNPLLGDASATFSPVLRFDGKPLASIRALAAGSAFAIAADNSGRVWTWGDNSYGQLGDGSTTMRPRAVMVNGLSRIVAVSASTGRFQPGESPVHDHVLALDADGFVWAWGENRDGEVGNGTRGVLVDDPVTVTAPVTRPQRVLIGPNQPLRNVVAIAAGGTHSLALRSDGTVWTWGYNGSGQLGDGTYFEGVAVTAAGTPVNSFARRVPGLDQVRVVGAGPAGSFAIDAAGRAWSWGWKHNATLCLGPPANEDDGRDPAEFITSPRQIMQSDGSPFNVGPSAPLRQFY